MTMRQRSYLLMLMHQLTISDLSERLKLELKYFDISDDKLQAELLNIQSLFENGIGNINSNQLKNILTQVQQNGVNYDIIKRRLEFYEINKDYHDNIIQFFLDHEQANEPIDVGELDSEFRGVQVASRDNFNIVINQGWSGDWDLNPDNIEPKRLQVASMNDDGVFPRGCYLNADIVNIQPIQYPDKIRYRLFIANAVIINSGNRNVKFIAQPVRYIK